MHLYIHIPFCKQKCNYCNFHFSTLMQNKSDMVLAICRELELRKNEITTPIQTIYFGGGTPSVLNEKELNKIFRQIERLFIISNQAEITLEANPDDLDLNKIREIKHTPINRFSIGIQSFYDEDLVLMNRAHNAQQADACIKRSQDFGFENITIDLIYGSPSTTDKMWYQNLNKAIDLNIPHISSYALTVEPKTILQHQIKAGSVTEIDEQKQQNQFNILVETLTKNGFDHYEISNFGKPSYYSKHNSAYWLGKPYIGIGPSAHSYNVNTRSWNVANNAKYMKAIFQNKIPQEIEELTAKDILNELTMIGLRTIYGVDLDFIYSQIPMDIVNKWRMGVDNMINTGKLIEKEKKVYLQPKFRFFADGIASELFIL